MFTARPGLLDFVPTTVNGELDAVARLLQWVVSDPQVAVGLQASDVAEIVRSCFGGRDPSSRIARHLRRCGSESRLPYNWPDDSAIFGPTLLEHYRRIRSCKTAEDVVWLGRDEVTPWLHAVMLSLRQYASYCSGRPRRQAIDSFRRLANRHDCIAFSELDLPAMYDRVLTLCRSVADNEAPLRLLRDVWDGVPKPLPYKVYWSLQPLTFARSKDSLVHVPLLTLWTFRPSGPRWPPLSTAEQDMIAVSAQVAGERLHDDLWAKVETLFLAARLAHGLKPSEPTVAGRKCTPAVLHYADAARRPATCSEYMKEPELGTLLRLTLLTDDLSGHSLAGASHRRDLAVLRAEAVDENAYAPLYLLLPTGNIAPEQAEARAFALAWSLAFLEFTIAHESWLLWRRCEQYDAQWRRWLSAIEPLRKMADTALLFLHRLSKHDLSRFTRASSALTSGFFAMKAGVERLRGSCDVLAQDFKHDNDSTEDFVRVELKIGPIPGQQDLRDAVLDAYPYHYLRQPIDDLTRKLVSPLTEVESFRLLLDDADRRRQTASESFGRWLAGFLAFAAILIALPQLVPSVAFDESKTINNWLKDWQLTLFGHPVLAFAELVVWGRDVVIAAVILLIVAGAVGLGRIAMGQLEREAIGLKITSAFRLIIEGAIASEPIAVLNRTASLDDQDAKACQSLNLIYVEQVGKPGPSQAAAVSQWIRWLVGVRDRTARGWADSVGVALARTQLYGLDWSNPPPLPRLACILRYAFQDEANRLNVLALTDSEFRLALERSGFTAAQVEQLRRWLESPSNQATFFSTDPSGLADLLANRGVKADPILRTPEQWEGPFGYRGKFVGAASMS